MISFCWTLPGPDYQERGHEERAVFCRQVYLLRKRGYSIADAQATIYLRALEECMAAVLGKES